MILYVCALQIALNGACAGPSLRPPPLDVAVTARRYMANGELATMTSVIFFDAVKGSATAPPTSPPIMFPMFSPILAPPPAPATAPGGGGADWGPLPSAVPSGAGGGRRLGVLNALLGE